MALKRRPWNKFQKGYKKRWKKERQPKKPELNIIGYWLGFMIVLIFISISLNAYQGVIDKFTSVNDLTNEIYKSSQYVWSGSICNDGTVSGSQGRGACSHHGGVRSEFYNSRVLTIDQAKQEALKRSWMDDIAGLISF